MIGYWLFKLLVRGCDTHVEIVETAYMTVIVVAFRFPTPLKLSKSEEQDAGYMCQVQDTVPVWR